MLPELDTYDWGEAFAYANPTAVIGDSVSTAPFTREDVVKIVAMAEGENEGPNWVGVFRLRGGRWASLEAGCDYTGWDCQAGGSAQVASTKAKIIRFGLSQGDRQRLGLLLPEERRAPDSSAPAGSATPPQS